MNQKQVLGIAVVIFIVSAVGGNFLGKSLRSDSVQPISADMPANSSPEQETGFQKVASTGSGSFLNRLRPDYELPDLQGNAHSPEEWDGKVVVVNFWATWCAPCRKEIPAFNQLQAKYESKGVQFVGIALDDAKAVERFMQVIPIEYTVLIGDDEGFRLTKQFGNVDGVLPYTVFLDRNGGIASIAAGGLSESVTETTLKKLL